MAAEPKVEVLVYNPSKQVAFAGFGVKVYIPHTEKPVEIRLPSGSKDKMIQAISIAYPFVKFIEKADVGVSDVGVSDAGVSDVRMPDVGVSDAGKVSADAAEVSDTPPVSDTGWMSDVKKTRRKKSE